LTGSARTWLPANILENAQLRRKLDEVVGGWSRAWFPSRVMRVSTLSAFNAAERRIQANLAWRIDDQGVGFDGTPRIRACLAEWALALRFSDHALRAVDRQLIDGMEGRIVSDLLSQVGVAFAASGKRSGDPFAAMGGVVAQVADSHGDVLFSLAVPFDLAVPFCRPPAMARRPARPIGPVVDALGPVPMTLEILLGEAELSVADLQGLAPGDVVVLGSTLSEPAPLQLIRAGELVARARLTEIEGRAAVVVQS